MDLLITVMIIGILGAVAAPKFAKTLHRTRVEAAARRIKHDLEFARRIAISQSSAQLVSFTPGTDAYQIPGQNDPQRPDRPYLVELSSPPYSARLLSATLGVDTDVQFDRFGVPDSGGTITVSSGSPANSNRRSRYRKGEHSMSGASYPRSVRRGYTLLELMIAMVGATTLMAGLSSAIFVAVQAAGTDDSPLSASRRGGAVLSDLLAELEFARSFTETTPTAITMIVPDRDGDTIAETIRYAWSGTPGDPLTRQYNGGLWPPWSTTFISFSTTYLCRRQIYLATPTWKRVQPSGRRFPGP